MIKLDELKPIIEPLMGDNAADIIEQITAIDVHEAGDMDQTVIDNLNAEWNERFKKAFFGGERVDDKGAAQVDQQAEGGSMNDDGPKGPTTFEELFKEGE